MATDVLPRSETTGFRLLREPALLIPVVGAAVLSAEEEPGAGHEGAGDGEHLLFPAGQVAGATAPSLGESGEQLEDGVRRPALPAGRLSGGSRLSGAVRRQPAFRAAEEDRGGRRGADGVT